ncbi:MAG: hypothetical protein P8M72_11200 [Gammaproteobacteria bacterium]|nr:hypothetical protein [Gammaproteobacteria bacterium]
MPKVLHLCPHCHKEEISSYQKLFSVSFSPAVCPACNQESFVPIIQALIMLTVWTILTWVFIGLSIMSSMSFFLLGTIPAFIVCVDKYILKAPLVTRQQN